MKLNVLPGCGLQDRSVCKVELSEHRMELAQKTAGGKLSHARCAANQLCGEGSFTSPKEEIERKCSGS